MKLSRRNANREDTVDKIFASSFFEDKIFKEESFINSKFSQSTKEVMKDPESNDKQDQLLDEVLKRASPIGEKNKSKEMPNKKSKKAKITQKVRSFDNRKRFGK
uniref:Uncharacterized protein n=1 Tax=Euplotes crassus TaxID=5936 RepID=A0A7S3NRE6_EUPCR|mmetsp:Transcript_23960/g.23880  ORF Transcript_23960/g.23880 Transcript_23960/m.23880 type:complete len:104 (+) Transcript_23960:133-444(+)